LSCSMSGSSSFGAMARRPSWQKGAGVAKAESTARFSVPFGAESKGELESGRTLASGIRLPIPIPAQRGDSPFNPGGCADALYQRAGHHQAGVRFGQVPEATTPFFETRNHNVF
jgi:hypothetical protein